jgi:hypothetical protein
MLRRSVAWPKVSASETSAEMVEMWPKNVCLRDEPAAGNEIAGHRTLKIGRALDDHLQDRLEQHRLHPPEGFGETIPGRDAEGHFRTVDRVVRTVHYEAVCESSDV